MASADFSASFPMPPSIGSLFRQVRRPPRVRRDSFPRLPPDLPRSCPSGYRASLSIARLPHVGRPCIRFLFVGSGFCLRLPSDPASRQRPCLQLTVPTTTACKGLAPSDSRHAWRTKKKACKSDLQAFYLALVRQAGFESSKGGLRLMPQPATYGFVVRESILPIPWI